MKTTRLKRLFVVPKFYTTQMLWTFLCIIREIISLKNGGKNMENIIFGIMVVIALGAGIFTCIYEIGGSPKTDTKHQKNDSEKGKN